jgi:hypothetical protein
LLADLGGDAAPQPWRRNTSPAMELSLIVTTASPVIRTRSLCRKNDT